MKVREPKLGRNDKCWCASGRKYKHCHLRMEEGIPISKAEFVETISSQLSSAAELCMHPDAGATCSEKVIKAHSVQRGGGLSRIARRGEVYYFRETIGGIMNSPGRILPTLVGYKHASTFTGFCGHHDSSTFRSIDDLQFASKVEQVFLLGYRALCREVFLVRKKKAFVAQTNQKLLRGVPREIQELAHDEAVLVEYNLSEVELRKSHCDSLLTTEDYSDLVSYVIWLDRTPEVLCGASLNPWCDFSGRILQEMPNLNGPLQHCSFSIVAAGSRGAVILSWFKSLDFTMPQLAASLDALSDSDLPDAVLRFAFEHTNNVCLSPTWWETLPTVTRDALVSRAQSGNSSPRRPDCLRDDGIRAASFKVEHRLKCGW
jgi:SEC-C motif